MTIIIAVVFILVSRVFFFFPIPILDSSIAYVSPACGDAERLKMMMHYVVTGDVYA